MHIAICTACSKRNQKIFYKNVLDIYLGFLYIAIAFSIPKKVLLKKRISISRIRKYCEDRDYGLKMSLKVDIVKSTVGYDSGIIGAAALFME